MNSKLDTVKQSNVPTNALTVTTDKGDCYQAAWRHFMEQHEVEAQECCLVHGNLAHLPQGEAVNHAWIECGEFVRDVTNGVDQTVNRAHYYEVLGVTTTRRYNQFDARLEALKSNHYGPWP
jgi:hypothetical protein